MKRHYIELWMLLAAAFVIFAVASAFDMPALGGYELKSAGIAPALFAPRSVPEAVGDVSFGIPVPEPESTVPVECDSLAQTILFIGDSMLEGLSPRLAAYCDASGHELYSVVWYSSTSEVWGRSSRLADYIRRINPTFIFVCLGANELFVTDIESKRDVFVKKIIADIGDIPYLWIGPPNWKPDTGINRLIAANARPGAFFLSDGMTFERSKDGAHPTRRSAALWADSIVSWIPANSFHPIALLPPAAESSRPRRVFVHQPDER
ncbi:MAG: SGNH/GDSL hydrolase family protein [Muribaculaceae bacterium]|nr:SGNH/GDSL hydrolase family protein [Muribaculaceae bacterium]